MTVKNDAVEPGQALIVDNRTVYLQGGCVERYSFRHIFEAFVGATHFGSTTFAFRGAVRTRIAAVLVTCTLNNCSIYFLVYSLIVLFLLELVIN